MKSTAKLFSEIFKFNPYHDRLGRFTFANSATSFNFKPKDQNKNTSVTHDKVIEREKQRTKEKDEIVAATKGMAKRVVDENYTSGSKKEYEKQVNGLYREITYKEGIKWNTDTGRPTVTRSTYEKAHDIARKIMEKQEFVDNVNADEYHELHRTIKQTPIKISDYDKHDIADWNDYRKQNFGNVTISRNGISIDSFYQELSGRYPHLFDSNKHMSPSDQLSTINDVLNSLKPKKYTLTGQDLEDATHDLALQIINGYLIVTRPKAA